MPKVQETIDIWSVEGRFSHLIYSPRGGIEGFMTDTDGVPTQFVIDPQDVSTTEQIAKLESGQQLVVEGWEPGPSPKGGAEHSLYHFERLTSVDGRAADPLRVFVRSTGKVVRLNYARHGAANGVVLDNGDFVHTRPDGFETLGAKIGDQVEAEGDARALVTGKGRVVEASTVHVVPARRA